jgi:hypothetical protein
MLMNNLDIPALKLSLTHISSHSINGVKKNPLAVSKHALKTAALNIGRATLNIRDKSVQNKYTSFGESIKSVLIVFFLFFFDLS